ncbi:MAG: hypothetical protein ACLQPN_22600 [Bryobacteraceae bacterium]
MVKERNLHKQIAVGTWILVALTSALVALGVLTFVHPPDPARPMSFDSLTKPFVILPWAFAAIILLVIGGAVTVTRRLVKNGVVPLPDVDIQKVFDIHPTSLDARVTSSQQSVNYTAKLRFSLENRSDQTIRVLPPSWLTGIENISVQCGASPYPGEIYKPGMLGFGHKYQFEEYQGS